MRTLLLLAYFFPPIGGAGSQRNSKLSRYLADFGWDVVVVTGPGSPVYYWTPIDDSLLGEIPPSVRVHRASGPEPPFSEGWRARAERWLTVASPWERWWRRECLAVVRKIETDVDLVYVSLAPYASATAALSVARELDKPLVLDLEDPWAFDEMMIYPSGLHRRLELRRMRRTLRGATGVVMNTQEAAVRVRRRFPELESRVIAVPNGFDASDFVGAASPETDKVRIVHTGSLHTDFARRHLERRHLRRLLGGYARGVNLLTRSHVFLMQALRELRVEDPELGERFELHLAGTLTPADRDVIGNAEFVEAHGFLSHRQTTELMRSAALLFLPMHDLAKGERVGIVPCKTYEYLAAGKPILAAVPDGDARDLLAAAGNAYLCRPSDVEGMKRAIVDVVERMDSGHAIARPAAAVLGPLERRELTRRLASFLEQVLASEGGRRSGQA